MHNINKLIIESYYNNIINESAGDDLLKYLDKYFPEETLLDWLWKKYKIELSHGDISKMAGKEVDGIKDLMNKSAKEYTDTILDTGGDKVKIYRKMIVTTKWFAGLPSGKSSLGRYWTYDSESANDYDSGELFNDKNGIVIEITASVDKSEVDIFETFLYSFYNQKELRITSKEVELENIEITGYENDNFNIDDTDKLENIVDKINSKFKGKTFKL